MAEIMQQLYSMAMGRRRTRRGRSGTLALILADQSSCVAASGDCGFRLGTLTLPALKREDSCFMRRRRHRRSYATSTSVFALRVSHGEHP